VRWLGRRVYAAIVPPPPANSSSFTDLLQGWGTVAGAFFSAFAVFAAIALLWHEIRVRRSEEADRAVAQARLILPRLYPSYRQSPGDAGAWTVTNFSGGPILNVEVAIMRHDEQAVNAWGWETLVKPGEVARGDWEGAPQYDHPELDGTDVPGWSITVQFIDTSGLRWRRQDSTPPERVLGDPKWPFDDATRPAWVNPTRHEHRAVEPTTPESLGLG